MTVPDDSLIQPAHRGPPESGLAQEPQQHAHLPSVNGSAMVPPATATGAVLVASDPVPAGSQIVSGVDFNHHKRDITVTDLVSAMAAMGFQATAVADAVEIISEMVALPAQIPRGVISMY